MAEPLRWMSIKLKLPLLFGAVCLLAFGVGGYLVSRSAKGILENEILRRLEFQGQAYATALDSSLRAVMQRAEDFASDGYIRGHLELIERKKEQGEDTNQLRTELQHHLARNKLPLIPSFSNLSLLDQRGDPVVSAIADQGVLIPTDQTQEHPTSISDILTTASKSPVIYLTTPVQNLQGQETVGCLVAWVRPWAWVVGALQSESLRLRAREEETEVLLTLFDGKGRGLQVPEALRPGTWEGEIAPRLSLLADEHRVEPDSYSPTRATFSRTFPITGTSWTVQVKLKSHNALNSIASFESRLLAVGTVLACLASLLLFFPMRYLVRPLVQLDAASQRIKHGHFDTRVPVESGGEIGELTLSFNAMAEGLEQNTRALQEKEEEVRHERDRLNAVISSMQDGLIVLDAEGKVERSNHAASPFLKLLNRNDVQPAPHHVCKTTAENDHGGDCASCLFAPSPLPRSCMINVGSQVFEIHAAPIGRGTPASGRVFVARDVSDRIAQDEQQIHQGRLSVLGEVAAVMAHELNNPLTSISMFNQMLKTDFSHDAEVQECVEVIERNTDACKETIHNLLDYSTGATPEVEILDVHETLREVIRFLEPVSRRTSIKLSLDLEAQNALVHGDEVQLKQVFVNLMMNALQAMENQGTRLTISTEKDEHHLVIDVVDDGAGISEEAKDKIFQPFFTSKPRGTGTGLGLSTSRRIAEMHGGGLELVESRPGKTVFRVRLRCHENTERDDPILPISSPPIHSNK